MKICYLYPNLLSSNGSRGNVVCLCQRAIRRGFAATVTGVPAGHDCDLSEFDLIYLGAGHGEPSSQLLADAAHKGPELRAWAENGGVILAVCEGFELLAKSVVSPDGTARDAMGVLDMTVRYGASRRTGNYAFDCGGDIGRVVAFRNHAGEAQLGKSVSPLGTTPDGANEGARYKNVFGSYGHGPLLPKNPALADAVLEAALGVKLSALDDTLEMNAHSYMEKRLT